MVRRMRSLPERVLGWALLAGPLAIEARIRLTPPAAGHKGKCLGHMVVINPLRIVWRHAKLSVALI